MKSINLININYIMISKSIISYPWISMIDVSLRHSIYNHNNNAHGIIYMMIYIVI